MGAQATRLKLRTLDTSFVIAAMACGAATSSFALLLCQSSLPTWWTILSTNSYGTMLSNRLQNAGENADALLSSVVTNCESAKMENHPFCQVAEEISNQPSPYRL